MLVGHVTRSNILHDINMVYYLIYFEFIFAMCIYFSEQFAANIYSQIYETFIHVYTIINISNENQTKIKQCVCESHPKEIYIL